MIVNDNFKFRVGKTEPISKEEFIRNGKRLGMLQCPVCYGTRFKVIVSNKITLDGANLSDNFSMLYGDIVETNTTVEELVCTNCGTSLSFKELKPALLCRYCGEPIRDVYREAGGFVYHPHCINSRVSVNDRDLNSKLVIR